MPFAIGEARHHASAGAGLARAGTMIGANDLLIAATARSLGYTLVTLNFDEFARVPGLVIVAKSILLAFQTS